MLSELTDLGDLLKTISDSTLTERSPEWFNNHERHQKIAESIDAVFSKAQKSLDYIQKNFDPQTFSLMKTEPRVLYQRLRNLLQHSGRLEAWISFQTLLQECEKIGILDYLIVSITENIPLSQIPNVYRKLFDTQWVYQILNKEWVLSDLPRRIHDKIVQDFQEKDRLKSKIAQYQIAEKMSQERPETDILAPGSYTSILIRENEKKRNLRPVRVLLHDLSTLIMTLKPCFLMSPLSVSTYLESDSILFDVVIFDEASQIFPQDAIGAIYRAKQVVIVGDSKQMPPSSFFESGVAYSEYGEEEDYDDAIEDYESILDIASTRFRENRLKWHYRSKVEDLITFSNEKFYDHELITFPSNRKKAPGFGIDFHYLEKGIFDRERKTNPLEAEMVAKLVLEHFKTYPERSLGVVAFSISQQEEIDKVLTKMREKNDTYEMLFKEDRKEPFFIKNLETVQGDERDTIIFSIAYGYDSAGKFYHNFGPLNQEGGERRLNVAITRAKMNVRIVSSIRSRDIDLKKTQSRGVELLKGYLEYAEKGVSALIPTKNESLQNTVPSYFENAVADFLQEESYIVSLHVGTSASKVDLCVRHPEQEIDIIAIECDGATYRDGKNTRDRDRLRQEVLEKMGWRFYRIWSTDWFRNPKDEKERLLKAIEQAITDFDKKKMETVSPMKEEKKPELPKKVEPSLTTSVHSEDTPAFSTYVYTDMKAVLAQYYVKFCDFDYLFYSILECEAPISEGQLLKRICVIYQREKVTSAVKEQFYSQLEKLRVKEYLIRDGFFHLEYKSLVPLRVPNTKANAREIRDISIEELAGGFLEVIRQNIAVNPEGLYKSVLNSLGFLRMTEEIRTYFDQVLLYLIRLHLVIQKLDTITLVGKK